MTRKLPKWAKVMNFIYQALMIILGAVNGILTYLDNAGYSIPRLYFEICSIGIAMLPVVWSKLLDELKTCTDNNSESIPGSPTTLTTTLTTLTRPLPETEEIAAPIAKHPTPTITQQK